MASSDISALSATMRPADALSAAGLGQLVNLVLPLQGVLDRLAGNASAVHAFVDSWNTVSQRIAQIQQQFGHLVATGTTDWRGVSADTYRRRTDDFARSLAEFASVAAAAANAAQTTAASVAQSRATANDMITDLVQRLISLVRHLMALEGGMTSLVLAQAAGLVNSFAKPIAGVERQVQTTINGTAKPVNDLIAVIGAVTRLWDSYSGRAESQQFATAGVTRGPKPKPPPKKPTKPEAFPSDNPIPFADDKKDSGHAAHEAAHVVQQRGGVNL